jgi:type IV pilus assembly protein PilO
MLSPRDRVVVTIAAAALIVVALIAFLVYPQYQRWQELNAQVAQAQQLENAAKLQLQERQGFKDRAVETSAKWLRLQNQVPDNPDLPALIIELQDTGFKTGVQVVGVTPEIPSAADLSPTVTKVPISVEILGTWADTVDYMESLMRLDRGIRVMNMTTKMTKDIDVTIKRTTPLHGYAVDTILGIEAYVIPSASATSTPAAH